jgi:hypothetical protein
MRRSSGIGPLLERAGQAVVRNDYDGAIEVLQAALDAVHEDAPLMVNWNLLRIALLRDGRKTAASRSP